MAFAVFGPGILILTRTDIANQTPINVGYAQELSLDHSGELKPLHGTDQFALQLARGIIKTTGKIKAAMVSGMAWNSVFFGMNAFTSGGFTWNIGESHAIPADGHVTATQAAQFDTDLGAIYDSNRYPFLKFQTGSPAVGNYSVSAGGIYLFATAESGKTVDLTYSSSTTIGQSLTVTNQPIGTTPTFQLDYWTGLNQPTIKPWCVRLFNCVSSKLAIAPKLSDYGMPEIDFEWSANLAGNVMTYVFPEVD